jgi:PST family polysaccharide transporter
MTRTEHDELDTKIVRSSAWALLGFGGSNVFALATTIVLARLLVPEDFGLVALVLAVLAVAQIAQESGLGAALIVYRGELRPAAASVVAIAPLIAIGLYGIVFVGAPLFAELLDEPRLVELVRVTGLVIVLRGFSIMPMAVLEREMRFREIMVVDLGAGVAQSATAIVLAASGAGVWSLVAGQLGLGVAQVALSWALVPLRPMPLEARRETMRELMRFGRYVGLANLVNYANKNTESLVLGRILGTTPLGFFSVAKRLATLPVEVMGNILGRGVYAAFARLQADRDAFRRVWLEYVQRIALISVPMAIGLAIVAAPLVETLFGERWSAAIPLLQILALNQLVRAFSATSGDVFLALGRPQLRAATEVSHLVLLVPALVAGTAWGEVTGAAIAIVAVNLAIGLPAIAIVLRLLEVSPASLVRAIGRPAIGWALMTAALLALGPFADPLSSGGELVVTIALGAAVYGVAVGVLARDAVTAMWLSLRGVRVAHVIGPDDVGSETHRRPG